MRAGSLLALLALCLAFPPSAIAQIEERIPSRIFTPREGLPGSGVRSIAQTTEGLLWVGTGGGLAYFDGVRFNEVALPDTLSRSGIVALEPAPDGSLWVSTARHGVWNLSADFELRRVEELNASSYGAILTSGTTTYFLSRNAIWAVDHGAHGARQLSQGYPTTVPVLARASEDAVGAGPISAAILPDGRLVLLDAVRGPAFYHEANAVSFAGGAAGSWTSIAADTDGTLWALEIDRGLFRLDDELVPHLVLELDRSRHLLIHEGIGYITTRAGVVHVDLAAERLLDVLDETAGLPTSDSDLSYIDHEGSLWIGTRAGLIQVPRPRVRHIEYIDGQRLLNVSFLAPVADGELWGASYLGGLVRLAPTRGIERPLDSNRWTSVTETAGGQVVAIGNAGVATLAGGAWQGSVPLTTSVRGVGGPGNGAYVWEDHGAFLYSTLDGSALSVYEWPVEDRSYHAIGTAPGGDAVIRARDLLLRARVDPARSSVQIDTLARLADVDESPGRFLVMDPLGAVWIGFWDKGLVRVHDGIATTMLADEHVGQMRLSGDTLLYASSRNGLFAFDIRTQELLFSLYEEDGLLAATTAGAAIMDGTLFVAHPTGVTAIPLDAIGRTLPDFPQEIGLGSRRKLCMGMPLVQQF